MRCERLRWHIPIRRYVPLGSRPRPWHIVWSSPAPPAKIVLCFSSTTARAQHECWRRGRVRSKV
eukprot:2975405-Prymnesium_polylepis.1